MLQSTSAVDGPFSQESPGDDRDSQVIHWKLLSTGKDSLRDAGTEEFHQGLCAPNQASTSAPPADCVPTHRSSHL